MPGTSEFETPRLEGGHMEARNTTPQAGLSGGGSVLQGVIGNEIFQQILQGQNDLFELLLDGANLEESLEHIVSLGERILAPACCSIQLLDIDSRTVRHSAAPRLPVTLTKAISNFEIGCDVNPCSASITARGPVAIIDLETDPNWTKLGDIALPLGFRACWSQPIYSQNQEILGALAVFYEESHGFDANDRGVTQSMAELATFVVRHENCRDNAGFASTPAASLTATVPGVVYQRLVTPEGDIRYTYISAGAQELFGVSPEEILADPQALFDCHGPEYGATFRERLLKASHQLEPWDVELEIIARGGEKKWAHAIARPHRQPDGSVLWDGVILDATRIKQAELQLRKAKGDAEAASQANQALLEKLRSANQRFASLAAAIPGVIYQRRVSPDGDIRYTYISEGARDLFGVSPEEILADPQALFDRHGPEYRATFRERLLEASRKLEMWDVEAQIITRDGREKWTHAIARPQRLPDGSVLWDGIILDATRIKKAKRRLRKAKEAAETANKAKTNFLAQVSHELRTPLNAIIGFSELLKSQVFGQLGHPNYLEYAEDVHRSGVHLLGLINDILEFTDLDEGRQSLSEGNLNLSNVIGASVGQIAPFAEAAQVNLSKTIDHDLPMVLADEMKLRKILVILLSNAVKFTPQHGRVKIAAAPDDTGNITVSIMDTGIGIADQDMRKVLEPFEQADSDLNRKYEGTGLGIPLAAKLAEMHGAWITFASQVGAGTTATLVLPRERTIGTPSNKAFA